ncbi:MAG: PKD domain-containing protein [Flavobacteriales bacterium]|nr:PKD domain-containing protein [Flavobacteriales bacterium]
MQGSENESGKLVHTKSNRLRLLSSNTPRSMEKVTHALAGTLASVLIGCNHAPTSSFSYTDTENGVVVFSDSSKNAGAHQWDFGDGTFAQENAPVHTYEKNGKYNVKLTTSNDVGEASSITTVEVASIERTTLVIWTNYGGRLHLKCQSMVSRQTISMKRRRLLYPIKNALLREVDAGIHTVSAKGGEGLYGLGLRLMFSKDK